jgi:phenylpropionate dioxygenase-like ring-hydroxylating dioxygenase large terminal subunit
VANSGNYVAIDIVGERALISQDADGWVRAFHSVCRHRGSRVAADDKSSCKSAVVWPFHGWSYNLNGTLRSPAQSNTISSESAAVVTPAVPTIAPTTAAPSNVFIFTASSGVSLS